MNLFATRHAAIACMLALTGHAAQAEVRASLTYVLPTGVATTTDVIPMWVRLALAPDSDPLSLSNSGNSAYIEWFCEDGGFSDCALDAPTDTAQPSPSVIPEALPSPYVVSAHFGKDSWFELTQRPAFVLNAGESIDVHILDLTPRSGSVPAGFYRQQEVGLGLYAALPPESETMFTPEPFFSARTSCATAPDACVFSRNVITAVPELGSFWLGTLGGIGLLGLAAMRRRVTPT